MKMINIMKIKSTKSNLKKWRLVLVLINMKYFVFCFGLLGHVYARSAASDRVKTLRGLTRQLIRGPGV